MKITYFNLYKAYVQLDNSNLFNFNFNLKQV